MRTVWCYGVGFFAYRPPRGFRRYPGISMMVVSASLFGVVSVFLRHCIAIFARGFGFVSGVMWWFEGNGAHVGQMTVPVTYGTGTMCEGSNVKTRCFGFGSGSGEIPDRGPGLKRWRVST